MRDIGTSGAETAANVWTDGTIAAAPGPARRPIAAVLGAAMLFGTAGTAQALGPDAATPLGVGAARISVGTLVLWLAIALRARHTASRTATAGPGGAGPGGRSIGCRRVPWLLFVIGGVGVATYTPMFLAAVDRTGVALGTVVAIGSGPFFAGVGEWAWRHVRPSAGWLLGTLVTVAGGAVLVAGQSSVTAADAPGVDPVGVLYALSAGAGYALYSVTAKVTISEGIDSTMALAAPFTVGAVAVVAFAAGEPFAWLATWQGVLMVLELGVAATGVAYLLYGYGLARLTSATTVSLVLAEPLTATALAAIVLDEAIVVLGWVGIAVLCAGLVVVGRSAAATTDRLALVAS